MTERRHSGTSPTGSNNRRLARLAGAIAIGAFSVFPAEAYETDQFTNRDAAIRDSTDVLNREVNAAIADIVATWDSGADEMAVVNAIYRKIGGLHWIDRLERWAMNSPEVDRLGTGRFDSVYSGLPPWSVRVTYFFGVGKTIRLNEELVGTDKIGHFLSQGRKYYRRFRRSGSEADAALQSAFTERAIFGSGTTGAYSNADLVANYEGHRFYRSLFEDEIVPGKPAILRWQSGRWIIQRVFDWADHVNAYWDEALNVNHFDSMLYQRMRKRMLSLCGQYWENPALYVVHDEEALWRKYAHLGLRETRGMRLDGLCPLDARMNPERSMEAVASAQ